MTDPGILVWKVRTGVAWLDHWNYRLVGRDGSVVRGVCDDLSIVCDAYWHDGLHRKFTLLWIDWEPVAGSADVVYLERQ
jgi:hypothetical protein